MKVLLVVIAVIALIWLCVMAFLKYVDHFSPKTKSTSHEISSEKTHTKDDHDHKPAAQSGKHGEDHPHHSDGPSALSWAITVLVLVIAFWIGSRVVEYMGGFSIPKTRGQAQREQVSSAPSASSYQASVIPSTACSVTPKDARKVIAPVDGCSETIPVQNSGWYLCSDPGISSERVRSKSWFGSTEPTSWGDASTKGNKVCLGAKPSLDPAVPTEAVTVRVWEEKKVLP